MVYRKRRIRKGGKGNRYRRRYRKKITSYSNGHIYRFKRKRHDNAVITYNGIVTETHGAYKFKLNDLPGYTEFTALFDKYRIVGIQAKWMPRANIVNQSNLSSTFTEIPPVITVVDYDDATGTDDYSSLEQYENAKVHYEFKPFTLYFKPMIAVAAYKGAFSGYASSRRMWIDAASPDIEYYALKWATLPYSAGNNTTVNPAWDIMFTYYLQFKYPR